MAAYPLNYEIALGICDPGAIREIETWMLRLKADCSARGTRANSAMGLIEGMGRLFAPLL